MVRQMDSIALITSLRLVVDAIFIHMHRAETMHRWMLNPIDWSTEAVIKSLIEG